MNRKIALIPLIGAVSLIAITGCTDSSQPAGSALPTVAGTVGPSPSASASPTGNGIAQLNGADIVAQTLTASLEAGSAEISGSYTSPATPSASKSPSPTASSSPANSKSVTLKVNGSATNFSGTFILGERNIEMRRIGNDVYMKANPAAANQLGDSRLATGFVKHQVDDAVVTPWLQFSDPGAMLKNILQSETSGMTFTTGSATTVNGTPAIQVLVTENNRLVGTLTVATSGKPLPMKLTLADDTGTADLSFENWAKVPAVSAPSASELAK